MIIPFIISVGVFVVGLLVLFVGNLLEDESTRERWQTGSLVWIVPGVIASVIFGIVWGMSGPGDAEKCTAEGRLWISEYDELGPEANMCVDEQQYKVIYEVR